jgi:hypothetical protein
MNDSYRETTLRWGSGRQVIRTEQGRRSVSALETAHTKAVKAALTARKVATAEQRYAETVSTAGRVRKAAEKRYAEMGFEYGTPEGAGENAVTQLMSGAMVQRDKELSAAKRFPNVAGKYTDCRKGFPAIRYNDTDPASLAAQYDGVTFETIDPDAVCFPEGTREEDEAQHLSIMDIVRSFSLAR